MEVKKNPEVDLERRKGSFTLIGLLTALALTLVAFEWTAFEKRVGELGALQMDFLEEEVIPPSATPPPPPPPPPAPTTVLEIAVLGLLNESPMHGYELRKRLSGLLGAFRAFSYGSLYPTLRKLSRRGTGTWDGGRGRVRPRVPGLEPYTPAPTFSSTTRPSKRWTLRSACAA